MYRIIAWAYHGPKPPGMGVRHLCGNSRCINPEHLTYGTQAENCDDTSRMGRTGNRKLTDDNVVDIRSRYTRGTGGSNRGNMRELCAEYGISQSVFSDIVRHKHYKHAG